MTIIFSFGGVFSPYQPFGDTLHYLRESEHLCFEKELLRAAGIFLYSKAWRASGGSYSQFELVKAQILKICTQRLGELNQLGRILSVNTSESRIQLIKRYSSKSKYRFSIEIHDEVYLAPEVSIVLEYLQKLEQREKRSELCRAAAAFYYPFATLAFADPLPLVLKAVYESKSTLHGLITELGAFPAPTSHKGPPRSIDDGWAPDGDDRLLHPPASVTPLEAAASSPLPLPHPH
jgi:hypothetical protein